MQELTPERKRIADEARERIKQGIAKAADIPQVPNEIVDEGSEEKS